MLHVNIMLLYTNSLVLGTYGGHLELTAFAHLKRRDVKVIQPGLVYVIEWKSGADLSPKVTEAPPLPETPLAEGGARKLRRERKKEVRQAAERAKQEAAFQAHTFDNEGDDSSSLGAVYVA